MHQTATLAAAALTVLTGSNVYDESVFGLPSIDDTPASELLGFDGEIDNGMQAPVVCGIIGYKMVGDFQMPIFESREVAMERIEREMLAFQEENVVH